MLNGLSTNMEFTFNVSDNFNVHFDEVLLELSSLESVMNTLGTFRTPSTTSIFIITNKMDVSCKNQCNF